MTGSELSQLLGQLSRLAEIFGPFFFAILYVVVITRLAKADYSKICTRINPPATAEEIRTYRLYFICSLFSGLLLVALSIAWWFYYETRGSYTYQVAITNLAPNIKVDSPYFARESRRRTNIPNLEISDAYFLIVRDQPFLDGEQFSFTIWVYPPPPSFDTGGGVQAATPTRLDIPVIYHGKRREAYRLDIPLQGPLHGNIKLIPVGDGSVPEAGIPQKQTGLLASGAASHANEDGRAFE